MILLDTTMVGVILPTVQRELDLSTAAPQWVANAYLLALAAFVAVGGRLATTPSRSPRATEVTAAPWPATLPSCAGPRRPRTRSSSCTPFDDRRVEEITDALRTVVELEDDFPFAAYRVVNLPRLALAADDDPPAARLPASAPLAYACSRRRGPPVAAGPPMRRTSLPT